MVELGDNVDLLFVGKLPEDILKFGILKNAVGEDHGDPGAETDEIQMIHCGKGFQIFPDHVVGHHQRIAAGYQHVVKLFMLCNILHH